MKLSYRHYLEFMIINICLAIAFQSRGQEPLPKLKAGDSVSANNTSYVITDNHLQQVRDFTKVGPKNGTIVLFGGGHPQTGASVVRGNLRGSLVSHFTKPFLQINITPISFSGSSA